MQPKTQQAQLLLPSILLQLRAGKSVCMVKVANGEGLTLMPLAECNAHFILQSIMKLNSMGDRTHLCLTPKPLSKREDNFSSTSTQVPTEDSFKIEVTNAARTTPGLQVQVKKPWLSLKAVDVTTLRRQARLQGDMKIYQHINDVRNKLIYRNFKSFVDTKADGLQEAATRKDVGAVYKHLRAANAAEAAKQVVLTEIHKALAAAQEAWDAATAAQQAAKLAQEASAISNSGANVAIIKHSAGGDHY
ncbi:hypothetical protein QYM36_014708 [Artemia franciscana]|uniref:Uncharacterized protein n=1 Tax=Artemia franciscana TaxID=6661 RepID=A0AA88HJY7_ARTSF|nr:hypothetical protein QYM36_014708 [Artemia franciscana]